MFVGDADSRLFDCTHVRTSERATPFHSPLSEADYVRLMFVSERAHAPPRPGLARVPRIGNLRAQKFQGLEFADLGAFQWVEKLAVLLVEDWSIS